MCLSNHVSHCLEEFSPQTSPSGISYPMVGVPSMCPPPPINLWQYSTLHSHPLRAQLHCHIWTCLSNHVSHCLEEFLPQTSPSGISYPMVEVPSMSPPPPITLCPTSTLQLHPSLHPTSC